jgi:hypothetical protein
MEKTAMNLASSQFARRLLSKGNQIIFPEYFSRKGYADQGEDLILAEVFRGRSEGFWIDVGAYHPFIFSNTYLLYQHGWRGLNIDATPNSMELFKKIRPRDINVEALVSNVQVQLELHMFSQPALNTVQESVAKLRVSRGKAKRLGTTILDSQPLKALVAKYLPENTVVDFMSVDTEGNDLNVLRSNDWKTCRPRVIIVEEESPSTELGNSEVFRYLRDLDYRPLAKTLQNLIMIDVHFAEERFPDFTECK